MADKDDNQPLEHRRKHHGTKIESGVLTERAGVFAKRINNQRLIDRYLARGNITYRQWEAGDKLYKTWYAAGRSPITVSSLTPRVDGGGARQEMSEHQARRWIEFIGALRAMPISVRELVVDVCLYEVPVSEHVVKAKQRRGSGIYGLQLSLDVLADYFWP